MTTKYTWTLVKNHPFTNGSGHMRTHRYVWEQHHNAILLPWASIHHKNGRKCDNRIENLEVMSKAKHSNHHKPRLGTSKKVNVEIDCACGCGRKLMKYYLNPSTGYFDAKIRQYIHGHYNRGRHWKNKRRVLPVW